MSNLIEARVTRVHHWTDTLFTFETERDPGFRFKSGQFTMIGLPVEGRPLLRAYSIASAHYEERLEFFSIKVPNGPLTSRLQHLKEGDVVLINRKPTGTLVLDFLKTPGRNLYLFSTGTGLAPFLSVIRDPETYESFDKVVLTHTCRHVNELAYQELINDHLPKHELLGEYIRDKLIYYPSVTREAFHRQGRITDLIRSGKLFDDAGLQPLNAEAGDRIMICGSPEMLNETRDIAESLNFREGSSSAPGDYVIEKAFVEK